MDSIEQQGIPATKVCNTCKQELDLSCFYLEKKGGRLRPKCKRCTSTYDVVSSPETGELRCTRCDRTKTLDNFLPAKNKITGETGFYRTCKQCRFDDRRYKRGTAERRAADNKNRRGYLHRNPASRLYKNARWRASIKGFEFNLTANYVRELWRAADGKCALSGLAFDTDVANGQPRDPFRPSLDRIDNSKGYLQGNVRIILYGLNVALGASGEDVYLMIAKAVIEKNS